MFIDGVRVTSQSLESYIKVGKLLIGGTHTTDPPDSLVDW